MTLTKKKKEPVKAQSFMVVQPQVPPFEEQP